MLNAQRKGKEYERNIAKKLSKALDTNVRRTPCSGGLGIKGDILDLSGILRDWIIECKKQEHLNIWAAIRQARNAAGSKKWAVIFSRNNEGADYICMDINDWIEIIDKIGKGVEK